MIVSCEREWNNPYDENSTPDSWSPTNVSINRMSATEIKLSWDYADERIDGFIIDRKVGFEGNWENEYVVLDYLARQWIDNQADSSELVYSYKISAFLDDNYSSSKENSTLLLYDDFEGELNNNWIVFDQWGITPEINNNIGNPEPCLAIGDYGENGVFSIINFDYSNGLRVETDMYVGTASLSRDMGNGYFGLAQTPIDSVENNYIWPECNVWFNYIWGGSSNFGWDEGIINLGIIKNDGTTETFYQTHRSEFLNSFHRFVIIIRKDHHVEFYVDTTLIYATTSKINTSSSFINPLVLGKYVYLSSGVFHDNIVVYSYY